MRHLAPPDKKSISEAQAAVLGAASNLHFETATGWWRVGNVETDQGVFAGGKTIRIAPQSPAFPGVPPVEARVTGAAASILKELFGGPATKADRRYCVAWRDGLQRAGVKLHGYAIESDAAQRYNEMKAYRDFQVLAPFDAVAPNEALEFAKLHLSREGEDVSAIPADL